jgi:uncharacterized protein YceH (UPF0502 family)
MEPDAVEIRVAACLVEKQRTTPDTYPLSLNALLIACNQTSNRDPILRLEEGEVLRAIDALKARGMARIVHPGAGSRATKYRHVLDEVLALDLGELALLAVLLLRGAQTAAELRSRTERLHAFDDLGSVESALDRLADREEPLVRKLDRRPGEREARWLALLVPSVHPSRPSAAETAIGTDSTVGDRITVLEREVAELRSVVDRLRELLDDS